MSPRTECHEAKEKLLDLSVKAYYPFYRRNSLSQEMPIKKKRRNEPCS